MVTSVFVKLWGKRVGAVSWDNQKGIASFEYDKNFLKSELDISPILMPLQQGSKIFEFIENRKSLTFKGLPALLADILPDKYGNALINTWLVNQGRPTNSLNPVEILCFIGQRGMGALEFEPSSKAVKTSSTVLEIDQLVAISEQILADKSDFLTNLSDDEEEALFEMLRIGSSVGGARAKALIAWNEKTGEVRNGQAKVTKGFEHWLIKFDGVSDAQFGASSGYGKVEMAYYLMAKDAGIKIMESRLLHENGRSHFMTKRFDRVGDNQKLHVQTFCAMRNFDFNEIQLYSYEQLFETMRILGLSYPEAQELFRRMIFNVLARNCDDHTKNFGFMMDQKGKWNLSPAYDVCHAYRPRSVWVSQHALSINGKRQNITLQDFLIVAKKMNIKNAQAIIEKVADSVSKWNEFADEVELEEKLKVAIERTFVKV